MYKAYESRIYITRSINIEVNGKARIIEFRGGLTYPRKVFGIYGTGNLSEQKAIEDHTGFGTKFVLKSEDLGKAKAKEEILLEPEKEIVVLGTVTTDNAAKASPGIFGAKIVEKEAEVIPEVEETKEIDETAKVEEVVEDIPEAGDAITEVFDVTKNQDAKFYLMENFKDVFSHVSLSNRAKILAAAKEKNISFPNLN